MNRALPAGHRTPLSRTSLWIHRQAKSDQIAAETRGVRVAERRSAVSGVRGSGAAAHDPPGSAWRVDPWRTVSGTPQIGTMLIIRAPFDDVSVHAMEPERVRLCFADVPASVSRIIQEPAGTMKRCSRSLRSHLFARHKPNSPRHFAAASTSCRNRCIFVQKPAKTCRRHALKLGEAEVAKVGHTAAPERKCLSPAFARKERVCPNICGDRAVAENR